MLTGKLVQWQASNRIKANTADSVGLSNTRRQHGISQYLLTTSLKSQDPVTTFNFCCARLETFLSFPHLLTRVLSAICFNIKTFLETRRDETSQAADKQCHEIRRAYVLGSARYDLFNNIFEKGKLVIFSDSVMVICLCFCDVSKQRKSLLYTKKLSLRDL